MTDTLNITILQTDIIWQDPCSNLSNLEKKLENIAANTDIAILPETFSTGFTMNPEPVAQTNDGTTIRTIKQYAQKYQVAICSSFIAKDADGIYNRAFFITPHGEEHFYDKRHLFRMSGEDKHFTPGQNKCILNYMGWSICLMICYDLRFPVWSRNTAENQYDALIYMANWPEARREVWKTLLPARAIENICYVVAANRVGKDADGYTFAGESMAISPRGKTINIAGNSEEDLTATLSKSQLETFRHKFPAWKDADKFKIID